MKIEEMKKEAIEVENARQKRLKVATYLVVATAIVVILFGIALTVLL